MIRCFYSSSPSSSYGCYCRKAITTAAARSSLQQATSTSRQRLLSSSPSLVVRWQTRKASIEAIRASSSSTTAAIAITAPVFDHSNHQSASALSSVLLLAGGALGLSLLAPETETTKTEGPKERQTNNDRQKSGKWKDGLLYDDPQDDEPTTCVFCNLYRQGPCRPYWRAFEDCVNRSNSGDGGGDGGDNKNCQEMSQRFITECLSNYIQLYTLIDLQTWQDEVFDDLEASERQSTYQDIWSKHNNNDNDIDNDDDNKEDNSVIPQRVMNILKSNQLYEQVQDCYWWADSIRIDWDGWAKLVQATKWNKAQVEHMIRIQNEWLHQQQQQQHEEEQSTTIRPVWWNKAPSLPSEGVDQILDYLATISSNSNSSSSSLYNTTLSSPPPPQPNKPWPFQYRPQQEENNYTTTTMEATSSTKHAKEGQPFWHLLENKNPILIPIKVSIPKKHPSPAAAAHRGQLQYAYCRDADTGMLLGYYYPTGKKSKKRDDDDGDDGNDGDDNDNNNSKESPVARGLKQGSKNPNHDKMGPPKLSSLERDKVKEEKQQKNGSEDLDPQTRFGSQSSQDSSNDNDDDDDDSKTVTLVVNIMPGRTSSIQFFGSYVSEDDEDLYEFLETPPIRLVDSIFIKKKNSNNSDSNKNGGNDNDDDEEVVVIHNTPQALGGDLKERFEKYQLLHNFCKYQIRHGLADTNNNQHHHNSNNN